MDHEAADLWFNDLEKTTHALIHRNRPPLQSNVKIAVIDSGIDGSHPTIQFSRQRIKAMKSWETDGLDIECSSGVSRQDLEQFPLDDTGHGTHKAALILRTAPWADLYVAKVVIKGDVVVNYVAEAIIHAAKRWQVDIISLSLGWARYQDKIYHAITQAVHQHVLIFAAASNEGSNSSSPAYPASDERVICMNSAYHNGGESNNNPPLHEGQNLSILGENVRSAWPRALSSAADFPLQKTTSGTSNATAIAAGIGALLIDLARQDSGAEMVWAAEKLKTVKGMKLILRDMAKLGNRFCYIEPFTYLDGSVDDSHLGARSSKNFTQSRIFRKLQDGFAYAQGDVRDPIGATFDGVDSTSCGSSGRMSSQACARQEDQSGEERHTVTAVATYSSRRNRIIGEFIKGEQIISYFILVRLLTSSRGSNLLKRRNGFWDCMNEEAFIIYEFIYQEMAKVMDGNVNCGNLLQLLGNSIPASLLCTPNQVHLSKNKAICIFYIVHVQAQLPELHVSQWLDEKRIRKNEHFAEWVRCRCEAASSTSLTERSIRSGSCQVRWNFANGAHGLWRAPCRTVEKDCLALRWYRSDHLQRPKCPAWEKNRKAWIHGEGE